CAELFKRAKGAGLTTSFDPGWDPQEEWTEDIMEVLRNVDVFLPNEQEALNISDRKTVDEALAELGSYSQVAVIKQGEEGVTCLADERIIRVRTYRVEPVDTTGAGDSFNAGFLNEWLQGSDIRQCLKAGAACGALATTKMGGATASPTMEELKQFLASHEHEDIFGN
ncbi:MAG: carbohydrate kinase family protein, partial [Candidatus Neomarinimicrobiota bacterium]